MKFKTSLVLKLFLRFQCKIFFFWHVECKIFTIKKKFIYEYNKRISSNLTVLFRNSYEYDMELFYGKCCAMTNSCKTQ